MSNKIINGQFFTTTNPFTLVPFLTWLNAIPETIKKEIREVISNTDLEEKKTKKMSKKEMAKNLDMIEQEMREAARNLDFERAMELRDILFEMKSN